MLESQNSRHYQVSSDITLPIDTARCTLPGRSGFITGPPSPWGRSIGGLSMIILNPLHARCGRRVAGMPKAKDVMNRQAQQRHDYVVERLPDHASTAGNRDSR
jgi:hypothetical protein